MPNNDLAGLRVIELARVLAGPWAGQSLSDLGADVIKVESPAGDETRRWGPPFVHDADGNNMGAAYFHSCNRGKRSVVADLNTEAGRDLVNRLLSTADVLIENFRVGSLTKFGLDYQSVKALNSRLIYCSITGFGQTGPYAQRPGYDFIIQGMSGMMDLTGEPDGAPQKIGVALADILTGLYSVIGIQNALLERQQSNRGCHLDMALFDSMVGVLANQALNYFTTGHAPRRMGNAHPNISPYEVFPTADSELVIAVGNDQQFLSLCEVLELEEYANSTEYESNEKRVASRATLSALITERTSSWQRDALLRKLLALDVPAGPVSNVQEVFEDPQVRHRGMAIALDFEAAQTAVGGTPLMGVRTPIVKDGEFLYTARRAPALGEHTQEILRELSSTTARD
ncbi:MAG: CaiB/BaiF CoA-transferase family protein [Gammaproteobacteria bacterium]|nr:CaiB/BaiF CoA-transferase family protein [Gammaproteobacteria bacterium]